MAMKLTKAERLLRQAQREEEAAKRASTPEVKSVEKQIEATEKKVKAIKAKIEKESKPVRPVIVLPPVPIIEWHGAYDQSWKGFITDESFAHPAKASRALLGKIFDHLFSIGALSRGGSVIDPFGGIGTTGIIGAWRACEVTCCELEPRFFELAKANFAMHAENLEHMGFPQPRIVNGDSRKLRQHICRADSVVSSPPYAEGLGHGGTPTVGGGKAGDKVLDAMQDGYGETTGQLTGMTEGEVDAVVSSPPYAEIATGAGGLNTKPAAEGQQGGRSASAASQDTDQRYGVTEGQLSRLQTGTVEDSLPDADFDGETYERDRDHSRLKAQLDSVFAVMKDHNWHTLSEISALTGAPEQSVGARLRDLRKEKFGGHVIERQYIEAGLWHYRFPSQADVVISSPPYEAAISERGGRQRVIEPRCDENGNPYPQEMDLKPYGDTEGQLGSMQTEGVDALISSPPYSASGLGSSPASEGPNGRPTDNKGASQPLDQYGETEGQLNHIPKGDIDAVISSPPYSEQQQGGGIAIHGTPQQQVYGDACKSPAGYQAQGNSEGQLGDMAAQNIDALVSSPPFGSGDSASAQSMVKRDDKSAQWVKANVGSAGTEGYGTSDGQLAQMPSKEESDTFWTAARDIVKECYDVLKPGGHAAWIVKAFVRDKQIVDFPGDWRKLCEYVGFETLTEVRAMLVKKNEYVDIFGEEQIDTKERKSFFRRLAEKNGSPKIDFEVVWIMRKP